MPETGTADALERSPTLTAAVRAKLGVDTPPTKPESPETPELPGEVEPEETETVETGGTGVTEVEPGAGTEEAPTEETTETPAEEAPGVSITIPTANADGSKGPAGAGEWVVEGLPQEAADSMRFHIKRSGRLPKVEKELTEARERAGVGDFFTQSPDLAMALVAREKPDIAAAFVKQWGKANWRALAALVGELKLGETDERTLDVEAQLAQRDATDAISKGYQGLTTAARTRAYVQSVDESVQDTLDALHLSPEDKQDLEVLIGRRISEVHQQRKQAGRDPFLQPQEVIETIQPLVARFATRAPAAATPAKPAAPVARAAAPVTPALSAEELTRRADQAAALRKVNGKPGGVVRPKSTGKIKSTGRPLVDAINRIRHGA